jgi:serine/threonine-protein kinase
MSDRTVGGFELIHALGQGAAAAVYRVRDPKTGEQFAMKLLHPDEAEKPSMQQRFIREAVVLKQLNHPNIVRFVDCGIEDNELYIVMELVECGSLKSAMKNFGAFPWRTAVKVAGQISEGLAHAHEHGVIHRDLKPANVFVSTTGTVKIGDFGLARDLNRHRLTVEAAAIGTCRYMAPEQIRCEDGLTGSVDLYALGTVIYQMIVNKPMFGGTTHSEVFDAHLNTPAPQLSEHAPDCPADLARLVDDLVAKSPADRPKDARAVAKALLAILRQYPSEESRLDHPALKAGAMQPKRKDPNSETWDDISIELLPGSTESNPIP